MSVQRHRSDPRILGRRTLEQDHRVLAALLRPGLAVLDVGCGTGAITSGIARAVAPNGTVVGLDRDEGHLRIARDHHSTLANLTFAHGDAKSLTYEAQFDIVSAARTLQWIAEPSDAILNMKRAARNGGLIVVLDYSHVRNRWLPDPPRAFVRFYQAFLTWRHANGWDNEMADRLSGLFRDAGLTDIESHVQDEIVERGDTDFAARSALWVEVIDNVGEQIATAGFCTAAQVNEARNSYSPWVTTELLKQTLSIRTVTGRVP